MMAAGDPIGRDATAAESVRPRVLVIGDSRELRESIERSLRQAGYDVLSCATGKDGLRIARDERPDAVLLDPDVLGLDVCRALKEDAATRHVPVIIVTARGDELDRVVGFELGAADYVVKPFSVRELILRVRAVLGRGRPAPLRALEIVRCGLVAIDREAHRVWVDGTEVRLTAIELRLLLLLYERRNRVQSREVLLRDVWGTEPDTETRTIDTHVRRLRAKLGRAADHIRTIRGVGYRFTSSDDD